MTIIKSPSFIISPDVSDTRTLASGFPLPNGHFSDSSIETMTETEESYLSGLNPRQQEGVLSNRTSCLILAGAGSGKTRVLVSRMAYLIEQKKLAPTSILAVTFTNKAASELRQRLDVLLKTPFIGLWVGTFHGICHRILRRHYQEAKLSAQFSILDSEEQARVIKRVLASLNLQEEQWPVKQAQSFINTKKDAGLRPAHIPLLSNGHTRTFVGIYTAYEEACHKAGCVDFAELLLRCQELLRENECLLAHYRQKFQAILVDEFQDTNAIQYAWIRLLAGENTLTMAVGDDDQSIYGWRGAKVENIGNFVRDFKDSQVIKMEQNYRSTANILGASNALIAKNSERMGKKLWTNAAVGEKICVYSAFSELHEARFVSESIRSELSVGQSASKIAILYRSNAQSRVLEEALLHLKISYKIHGGLAFFLRSEVKDAIAYLRILANPNDDIAFERIINFPTRGIGDKTLQSLRELASINNCSLWDALHLNLVENKVSPRTIAAINSFIEMIENLRSLVQQVKLGDAITAVLKSSGLIRHYTVAKVEKSETKLDNLQELVNAGIQFQTEYVVDTAGVMAVLHDFLAHASLDVVFTKNDAIDCVNLMTLHAAKGLEFSCVFIVGLEEGIFPSKQALGDMSRLEEERRLCYVGMTRTMHKLTLSHAQMRRQYGREEPMRPSRFLRELPDEFLIAADGAKSNLVTYRPTAKLSIKSSETGLQCGQKVKHPSFGEGRLLSYEGSGAHTRVEVKFREGSSKWLVLAYAKLEFLKTE